MKDTNNSSMNDMNFQKDALNSILMYNPWMKGAFKKAEEMGASMYEEGHNIAGPEATNQKLQEMIAQNFSPQQSQAQPSAQPQPVQQQPQGSAFQMGLGKLLEAMGNAALGETPAQTAALKSKTSFSNLTPQQMRQQIDAYNEALPENYQADMTAEGHFVGHPKPAGILSQLSPEQIDAQAENLIANKVAPSQLPRTYKNQIISAATEKDPNYNPAKADIDFATNKLSKGQFTKYANNILSFEDTFKRNAAVALKLSDNFNRSKIPLLNRAIMAGKLQIQGDPEASRMLASLYTVATEYARLTSSPNATGSQITDSARHEAMQMLNSWQNAGTIRGLLDPDEGIMSIDANNRVGAVKQRMSDIDKEISGNKENVQPEKKMDFSKMSTEQLKARLAEIKGAK